MDLIKDTPLVRWTARIFLIIVVILIIKWCFRKNNEYEYTGITHYHSSGILDTVANYFNQPRKRRRKRQINKTEEMCRKIIEKIYQRPFPTARPDFLKSPVTRKNLELDCYNKDLRIALEYNGQQHYTYTPHFHRSKKNFYSQVHRDDWKRKRCKELGIRLIEIPYWVSPIDLEDYILQELKKKGCL